MKLEDLKQYSLEPHFARLVEIKDGNGVYLAQDVQSLVDAHKQREAELLELLNQAKNRIYDYYPQNSMAAGIIRDAIYAARPDGSDET